MTAEPLNRPLLHSSKDLTVTQYRYVIRDHKGNPYAVTAENVPEAFAQHPELKPRNCTAEVLDTSVPYQKWDVVEVPLRLVPAPRPPARQRQVAKTTAIPTIPVVCAVCNTRFLALRSTRDTCTDKCRMEKSRNAKKKPEKPTTPATKPAKPKKPLPSKETQIEIPVPV